MINSKENIEALIVTSKVKYVPEFNENVLCNSVQTDDADYIPKLLKNITQYTDIIKFNIVHDFKIDNKYSIYYQKRLRDLSLRLGFRLITSPTSIKIPSQISATIAFKYGLKKLNSNYLLFWEHDHMFNNSIDWAIIDKCFANGGKMIRFNRKTNLINKNFQLNKDKTIEHFETSNFSRIDKNLLKTNFYSNGPFISEKNFCEILWEEKNYEFPSWNGFFGGFIEGPVNQFMLAEQLNMEVSEFEKKYPIYLYGGDNFEPIVIHQGDYETSYKIKGANVKSLITLLKIIKKYFIRLFRFKI